MDDLLTLAIGVALAYGLFELYAAYRMHVEPEPPGREADPTRNAEAVVTEAFISLAGAHVSGGKVDMNGTTWTAENHCPGVHPQVGDRVHVVERKSLTLIVMPIERAPSAREASCD